MTKNLLLLLTLSVFVLNCSEDETEPKCDAANAVEVELIDMTEQLGGCTYLFKKSDGTYLEPQQIMGENGPAYIENASLVNNSKYKITYSELEVPTTCELGPVINVDCIQLISQQ